MTISSLCCGVVRAKTISFFDSVSALACDDNMRTNGRVSQGPDKYKIGYFMISRLVLRHHRRERVRAYILPCGSAQILPLQQTTPLPRAGDGSH